MTKEFDGRKNELIYRKRRRGQLRDCVETVLNLNKTFYKLRLRLVLGAFQHFTLLAAAET